jgi:hypothetical protein
MLTADYINWVKKRTGLQTTSEEMRVLINSAQNKIFSFNTEFNKKKPEASCILPTTLGVKQYTLADTSIRQVSRIYVIDVYGDKITVPVQSEEAINPGDGVIVYFAEDPGTTTDKYYFDAYTWPFNGQITSSAVPLSVPEKIQTDYLFYLVSVMLEVDKDGRSIYNKEEELYYERDFFTFANQGASIEPNIPSEQGF